MARTNAKRNPFDKLGDELAGLRAEIAGVITRLPPAVSLAAEDEPEDNPPLSDDAEAEVKAAWLAGVISDETLDELDPDGLIQEDDDD